MRIVRTLAAGLILIVLGVSPAASASPATLALLAQMHRVFERTNPLIAQVHVLDVIDDATRPGHLYAALATGVTRAPSSGKDELFGVFVLDSTLTRVMKTIEVLPSGKLLDYYVCISFPCADTLLVRGYGASDHGAPVYHRHAWAR
ncbi:MAG: hypothetical protein HY076_09360 [Candidatus Eisenbacteria bacterium]|uniref:Uncharacterized protein n=1 Tax=Eiseniibacteriota bacterium TaxID=2212470 RepID=A0A9D6L8C7_UNCEI|nr:hypothetical protein [Candidatus Eisenbacteria bacterium]MBI3540466.1 hypothetical protein [Candidatus Eisenbacteria bacterium]